MKLKNEPKRHRFWSKIQFFFPRMTRVLTSSKLQIAFLPIWTFSLCAISFRRNVTDRELSKKERAHAWVPFPIQIEEPIENRCKNNRNQSRQRILRVRESVWRFQPPPKISVFSRVPSFLFRVWLAIGIGILSPPIPFVVDNSNGTLAPRKEKLNTGYTDFSSPTKMWKMHCFLYRPKLL